MIRSQLTDMTAIMRALGDEARMRAVSSLVDGELCVCQIVQLLGLSPSTVSRHMSLLEQAGLVHRRKEGRWHYYRLATDSDSTLVQDVLAMVTDALGSDPALGDDRKTIRRIRKCDLQELTSCYSRS